MRVLTVAEVPTSVGDPDLVLEFCKCYENHARSHDQVVQLYGVPDRRIRRLRSR